MGDGGTGKGGAAERGGDAGGHGCVVFVGVGVEGWLSGCNVGSGRRCLFGA